MDVNVENENFNSILKVTYMVHFILYDLFGVTGSTQQNK